MILFIKHIDIEGPETIGEYFKSKGFSLKTIDLSLGDPLPSDLSQLEAVVVLGGPMNVYEEEKYAYLKAENSFIKKILKKEIPYLGICLGSQLLAKACGAKVTKSPVQEIGWFPVELTEDGKGDPFFEGLGDEIEIFQWHGDTFSIPKNGKWLAKSDGCAHQALRAGSCAYGVQFHFEITDKSIREWSDTYFRNDKNVLKTKKQEMLSGYTKKKKTFNQIGETICDNFLKIIVSRRSAAFKEEQLSFISKKVLAGRQQSLASG